MIDVANVTKVYVDASRHAVRALENVSFEVREGEFLSLVGPSGCGKSTLLSLVAGLLPASEGSIRIRGHEVRGPQTDLGFVFQNDVLLEWRTAIGNVLLQLEARGIKNSDSRERAARLLDSVGLLGFESAYPRQLSGGMRQRVALCRAWIHNPPILLMDEPFGSLDAITRDQLGLDLARLWEDRRATAIFVTHSIEEAIFLSDRVMVMTPRPGQIAETIDVRLSRPRTLSVRETPEFMANVARIRDVFLRGGVLHE